MDQNTWLFIIAAMVIIIFVGLYITKQRESFWKIDNATEFIKIIEIRNPLRIIVKIVDVINWGVIGTFLFFFILDQFHKKD